MAGLEPKSPSALVSALPCCLPLKIQQNMWKSDDYVDHMRGPIVP